MFLSPLARTSNMQSLVQLQLQGETGRYAFLVFSVGDGLWLDLPAVQSWWVD